MTACFMKHRNNSFFQIQSVWTAVAVSQMCERVWFGKRQLPCNDVGGSLVLWKLPRCFSLVQKKKKSPANEFPLPARAHTHGQSKNKLYAKPVSIAFAKTNYQTGAAMGWVHFQTQKHSGQEKTTCLVWKLFGFRILEFNNQTFLTANRNDILVYMKSCVYNWV